LALLLHADMEEKPSSDATPPASAGGWAQEVAQAGRYFAQSFRLMVGLPNYDTYVAHMALTHPDEPVMSYEDFFRERQEARYGGKGRMGRCC
jgi:uncharacterized short protein YbdD (DUF466 family)